MAEYILRDQAIIAVTGAKLPDVSASGLPIANGKRSVTDCVRRLKEIPAADVVSRGAYDQTDWERCVALTQLKEIGKGLGERMDDVRPVVRGKWIQDCDYHFRCSVCGDRWTVSNGNPLDAANGWNYCPNCGAEMEES